MRNFILFLLILFSISVNAQHKSLSFNNNGKFKIIQFTDIHYKKNLPESAVALKLISEVLDAEKPDLVVFTGDVIYAKPVKEGLDDIFNLVIKGRSLGPTYSETMMTNTKPLVRNSWIS